MADKRSGPPSRGGPSKGGFGGRGGPGRSSDSRNSSSRGGSFGGRSGAPSRGFGGGRGGDDNRKFGDRPQRSSFGDRPPRGDFEDRPRRDFGDRPQRGSFGDRPQRGSFGDRPPRGNFGDRPQRGSFGDRPPRGNFEDRPRRDFGDRPQRGSFGDRPPRREFEDRAPRDGDSSFEDRKAPRRDRDMPFEDRPRRSFKQDGFGASRRRDDSDTQRPRNTERREGGSFENRGERVERREYSNDRPQRSFGDRPQRGGFGDRPQRGGFENRKFESRQGFDKRPSRPARDEQDGDAAPKAAMKGHELVIYGVHAVQAALRNPKRVVTTIWVTDIGEAHLEGAYDATRHPETNTITRREIEQKLPDGAVHQGIAIAVEPLEEMYLSDVLAAANAPAADRQVVVVLDEVTDPHNVGAILRSMSMFGAKSMIVHKRNAPSITGAMAKIATGAVEHVPMIPVTNLAKALEELQLAGFYCLGLDEDATIAISEAPKEGHIALVLGAEGEGLREKTRTTCNAIASITAFGEIKSLNVSNAAAIALFSITNK